MKFVSHQNSCFAPLYDLASHCSFDQQPKSDRVTLLQLDYHHKMHILSFYVLYACPDVSNTFMKKYQNVIVIQCITLVK